MNPKVGMCFYTRRGTGWCIYRYTMVNGTASCADPLPDEPIYFDREEARKRVYQLNGWRYKCKAD